MSRPGHVIIGLLNSSLSPVCHGINVLGNTAMDICDLKKSLNIFCLKSNFP